MGIAEEATDKIMSVSFRAISVTADLLIEALKALQESLSGNSQNKGTIINGNNMTVNVKNGKMTIAEISGNGTAGLVDISNQNVFQTLKSSCINFNINYSVMAAKGADNKNLYTIFFKTNNVKNLNKMLENTVKQQVESMKKDVVQQVQKQIDTTVKETVDKAVDKAVSKEVNKKVNEVGKELKGELEQRVDKRVDKRVDRKVSSEVKTTSRNMKREMMDKLNKKVDKAQDNMNKKLETGIKKHEKTMHKNDPDR